MPRPPRAAWMALILVATFPPAAHAQDYLRTDFVAAGALGVDVQERCERDYDAIGCQSLGLFPTLELSVEVRPWRLFGVAAFVGMSGRADSSKSASSTGSAPDAAATDRFTRFGLELRAHPVPLILPGAFVAAESGYLRFHGASDQSAPFVGGSLGYDFELLEILVLGPVAKVDYFLLDRNATSLQALGAQETAYSAGARLWLGLRAGVTFGSN